MVLKQSWEHEIEIEANVYAVMEATTIATRMGRRTIMMDRAGASTRGGRRGGEVSDSGA
jgi:hypothetical protein